MKRLLSVMFLVLVGMMVASAQLPPSITFSSSTPFMVGNATLPPGQYIIRGIDSDALIEVSSESAKASAIVEVEPVDLNSTPTKSDVSFKKYGNSLVLKTITVAGSNTAYQTVWSYSEKKAKKSSGKATTVSTPSK